MSHRYMHHSYILVTIGFLLFSSGCSLLSDPNSFAGRVGNFARGKLGSGSQSPNTTGIQDITSNYGGVTPINVGGDDGSVVNAQEHRDRNVMVSLTARVLKTLPDDRKGNPHQRFLLSLSNGTTVLVAHNIDLAEYVPIKAGDMVRIQGEYVWNERGGVIHYTHHSTSSKHQGGFIELNGQEYR